MEFIKIDLEKWNRKEHWKHFNSSASCNFNVTDNIDVTELILFAKDNKIEFYPIYLFLISKSVNEIKELRMTLFEGELGYYSYSNPAYTAFNKEKQIFYCLVTEYNENFRTFLVNYYQDKQLYKNSIKLFPQKNIPQNIINISSIPWVNFSAFDIELKNNNYLQPIITNEKYSEVNNIFSMPLSIRVNHSATDAFHVGMFFETFRKNIKNLINSYLTE